MSKLDQLIADLCPNGVEYKELGDIVKILDNLRKPITKKDRKPGLYPYYGANGIQDYIDNYIFDGFFLLMGEDGSVVNKDGSPILTWAEGKIWVNNHAHVLSELKEVALLRYIYFALQKTNVNSIVRGIPPKINQENLKKISIPVPPLPVQEEIVRILDKFTTLEAELEAELEARKKQYEYYRDELYRKDFYKLLKIVNDDEIKEIPLCELGSFTRGKRFVKTDIVSEGVPCIHYGELYTHYGFWADQTKSFISSELAAKLRVANKGDVVIVSAGETIEDLGKGVAWLGGSDVVVHDACYIYKHSLEPKYVSYFLRTKDFHSQIKRYISTGKISSISSDGLGKALIPVPSNEVQRKIVAILDRFDALVNDISQGLPAEIEARRKQYEYYRDKLLTFKEVG